MSFEDALLNIANRVRDYAGSLETEEATKNARTAGEKFARDSDSKLGKIKDATQGLFDISDRDDATPYIKKVRVVTSIDYYLTE